MVWRVGKTPGVNTFAEQGFPHRWRIDTTRRVRAKVSSATSSPPVFIGSDYIWSNEGVTCKCGPAGTSAPDGRVIAHNMRTGVNSVVLGVADLTASTSPTDDIEDVWFG